MEKLIVSLVFNVHPPVAVICKTGMVNKICA
jgi:hypothetical protein